MNRITNVCLSCGKDISYRVPWAVKCNACVSKTRVRCNKEYRRRIRDKTIEHVVAFTCVDCNSLVLAKKTPGLYCERCKKIRHKYHCMRTKLYTEAKLSQHRCINMKKEEKLIINELRRLKLLRWRRSGLPEATLDKIDSL